MNLGNTSMDAGNMSALAALAKGGDPAMGSWDLKAMLQMFGLMASAFQGTRAVANAAAPDVPVLDVPAPVINVPEPEAVPAPEIVPIVVVEPAAEIVVSVPEIVLPEAEIVVLPPAEPIVVEEKWPELELEPQRMPADDEPLPLRKRQREVVWEDDMKYDSDGVPAEESRMAKRVALGNFDTFKRKTMNHDDCAQHFKPKRNFNLPPIIVSTRAQTEETIRGLERQYKVPLNMQAIRAIRSSKSNGPAKIRLLKMEIAETEREIQIAEELEELLEYCENMRKVSTSRTVKNALAMEARFA
jgi:hypothetical protein